MWRETKQKGKADRHTEATAPQSPVGGTQTMEAADSSPQAERGHAFPNHLAQRHATASSARRTFLTGRV